ncbi:Axial budding pattern protein 2 [Grifola frondosa]|uniref:Axial budding pattern protein 2 n=1 Tax=Grifola frondosa TaxID=5627 RepID=A0A1C7LKL0_GRIFR|nr:Axial budding pattern protein 2 [Grifola frondosa]
MSPLNDQLPPIARINALFTWTFSSQTFVSSTNATLEYSASALPSWLFFDSSSLTLHGLPSADDEGAPGITITARDPKSSDSASSHVTLCVTPYPAPSLNIPVTQQFSASNPSLSSVFLLASNSALSTSHPGLRIPPKWSFSIGFQYNTFTADGDIYYAASQADGSPIPDWMSFNPRAITFDGVTPSQNLTGSLTISLMLHAADQAGYSAAFLPFDIVIAAHELSLSTEELPTINITAATPFNFSLNSAADFSGVLLDGEPVRSSDIVSLDMDTSRFASWLKYDPFSKTLSGQPPSDLNGGAHNPLLPVTLISSVNQTIHTNVSLAVVPSFFSTATLQPILITPGHAVQFDLESYFSNSSGLGSQNTDVNLTAAFDPPESGNYLTFQPGSAQLVGTVPVNITAYDHITITFTAYSRITHSTSHTILPISLSTTDYAHQHSASGNLSVSARAKLLLALKIAFGVVSGIILLVMSFAAFRRYARVPDTAGGAKKEDVGGAAYDGPKSEYGYGSLEKAATSEKDETGGHGNLGVELRRVLTRTPSNPMSLLSPRSPQSPGVMRKGDFIGKIRTTARIVSDKYRVVSDKYKRAVGGSRRPVISKPMLIMTSDNRASALAGRTIDGLPFTDSAGGLDVRPRPHSEAIPFEDMDLSQYAPSGMTSVAGSPSSSTGQRSIPRRRADFAPPRTPVVITTPPQVHLDEHHTHTRSVESLASSLSSNSSTRTHEREAIVQTATRATSVRSAASALSFQSRTSTGVHAPGRPRLVPFTSATRVPVPKLPTSFFGGDPDAPVGVPAAGAGTKRVASQIAKVFRSAAGGQGVITQRDSPDDLSTGVQYVQALGDNGQHASSNDHSSPRSFSSLESSHHGHHGRKSKISTVPRMLARTGEQFKFRVPISYGIGKSSAPPPWKKSKALEARLISGKALPKFIKVNLDAVASGAGAGKEKRVVEFWGTPQARDTGEVKTAKMPRKILECGRLHDVPGHAMQCGTLRKVDNKYELRSRQATQGVSNCLLIPIGVGKNFSTYKGEAFTSFMVNGSATTCWL